MQEFQVILKHVVVYSCFHFVFPFERFYLNWKVVFVKGFYLFVAKKMKQLSHCIKHFEHLLFDLCGCVCVCCASGWVRGVDFWSRGLWCVLFFSSWLNDTGTSLPESDFDVFISERSGDVLSCGRVVSRVCVSEGKLHGVKDACRLYCRRN